MHVFRTRKASEFSPFWERKLIVYHFLPGVDMGINATSVTKPTEVPCISSTLLHLHGVLRPPYIVNYISHLHTLHVTEPHV
jgi:hypothetical protein